MTTLGPTAIQSRASKPPPTSTASNGTSHIQEKRCSLRGLTSGTGRLPALAWSSRVESPRSCSLSFISHFRRESRPTVTDGYRGIAHGRQHCKDDDHAET